MLISQYLHHFKLCSKHPSPQTARALHARLFKLGLSHSQLLLNCLLDAYGKCGHLQDALNMFDQMPHRDLISWASFLTALNQANRPRQALSAFPTMLVLDALRPDNFVLTCLVRACAGSCELRMGKQVHAQFLLSRFNDDDIVKSSLVDMYAKCGVPNDARAVFDSISVKNSISWTAVISGFARTGLKSKALELSQAAPVRNLFSWTALISGFVQSGNNIDAVHLFIEMRREGIDIVDPLVLSSIVGSCANLALLELGRQVHANVIALGYNSCLFIANALVDMYAKCSDIISANGIFSRMQLRDVVSWTSLLIGFAQHGRAKEALALFDEMVSEGIKPNEVTFIGLIYACSHAGLVDRGRDLFKSMTEEFGIKPSLQHYTCFLDLMSRSGHLDEAERVIHDMPFQADEPMWAALLSACKQHGKTKMAIRISDRILDSRPEDPSTFILLSNIYAAAGLWDSVAKVRKLMTAMEVRKKPGFSRIDIGKENQVFYAGETNHPMKDEILVLLKELESEMRRRGYVPDTRGVLHDMEQQEKERLLFWHSERLAVAYGLIKTVPGSVIRIVKNLRVCVDCHTVLKFVSDIVKREIVVRDATRYHHFKDGTCSCNDFW
ncbi:pentatricopeptide repeat-containing protein At4g14050, mitochondrial [Punica granatum]|uniref:DYW domain-containing protein n=2 Tax=Punica granatum TaxID=22663 RepID=A0A218WVQ9_PUNGR|nr:pentatricopeptide repeat-containing protein At4g14050, mitochondrial [Punica granatum]OWM76743.1 hypothetical protein CDL15_Pgr004955 [Punica granatum]PKI77229.1 hypothetical protein CRG98_002350 [Punica granatum]